MFIVRDLGGPIELGCLLGLRGPCWRLCLLAIDKILSVAMLCQA